MSNQPHNFNYPNLEDYCFLPSSTPNDQYQQQILQETFAAPPENLIINVDYNNGSEEGSEVPNNKEVMTKKMSERHRRVKQLLAEKVITTGVEGSSGEGSSAKKLHHNAKERMRRMRMNASYLALRALLPDSRRSKKRSRTAPAIIDRVLKYIPELENEIEDLKRTKDNAKNKQEQQLITNQEPKSLTVSVNEVQDGEAIVQICKEGHEINEAFSKFLENMEAQQICIKNASTLSICHNRICYQLHIQWNANVLGADYIRTLRDRVICWLR